MRSGRQDDGGDLANQVSSRDFHLGSRVCGKQLALFWISGLKCRRHWCLCVLCPLEHRPWALESGRPGSKFHFYYLPRTCLWVCFLSAYSLTKCLLLLTVSLEGTLLCQGLTLQLLDMRRSGEIWGKRLEAVACYQPCGSISEASYFNWVLSETKPSEEDTGWWRRVPFYLTPIVWELGREMQTLDIRCLI